MKKVYALIGGFLIFIVAVYLFSGNQGNGNREVYAEKEKPKESEDIIDEIITEKEKDTEKLTGEYIKIIRQIQDYKFPTNGVVKEDKTTVYYDNGYDLFKNGMGFAVAYDPNIGPAEPTKEQYIPVIVGLIHSTYNEEIHDWEDVNAISRYIEEALEQLDQAKVYAEEYPPFSDWLDETIGYLNKAKGIVPNIEAKVPFRKALTNIENFVEAKEIAEE
ncbi:hypothetical protein ACFSTA_20115 [Ornithinibacillus salinisoli]|uniref:S-layer homology domain-containing protein n=1 Tax=Ornithinibacillus salinisoli TaxID=1848459 RepID=A0ABW4W546_9BACI